MDSMVQWCASNVETKSSRSVLIGKQMRYWFSYRQVGTISRRLAKEKRTQSEVEPHSKKYRYRNEMKMNTRLNMSQPPRVSDYPRYTASVDYIAIQIHRQGCFGVWSILCLSLSTSQALYCIASQYTTTNRFRCLLAPSAWCTTITICNGACVVRTRQVLTARASILVR